MKTDINLHIHSSFSDGEYSVAQIVANLQAQGITYFSITDHDEVLANSIAFDLAIEKGLKYIPGIELTCNFQGELDFGDLYTMHIIGLGINSSLMKQLLDKNRIEQSKKLLELFYLLKNGKYERIQLANIVNSDGLILRRTFIAKELVRQGYFRSTSDVFKLLLDAPIFAPYTNKGFGIREGIETIHRCGGKAIWAHPFFIRRGHRIILNEEKLSMLLPILINYGLDGVETYYLGFSASQVDILHNLAQNNNLLESIATDFHGENSCIEGQWQSSLVYAPKDVENIISEIVKAFKWNQI